MGQTSKTLLTALIISLFSLSAIQGIKIVTNNTSKVLGETTSINQVPGVPCSTIASWQQRYCSSIGPSTPPPVTPTSYPYPTPSSIPTVTLCKTGYSSLSFSTSCKGDLTRYYYATYTCYNNKTGKVGDTNQLNCFTFEDLSSMAKSACAGITSCGTTPSPAPTSYPIPSPSPTSRPTPILRSVSLTPQGTFNNSAIGTLAFYVENNGSSYVDISFSSINFTGLTPNTTYQIHSCDAANSCASSTDMIFTSDAYGNYNNRLSKIIGSINSYNKARDFRLYQPLNPGPVPSPSEKTCFMYTATSISCLRGYFSL